MLKSLLMAPVLIAAFTAGADAGQAGTPIPTREATRAAQNALRNSNERTVMVRISPGPRVPAEVADAATPLLIAPEERLILQNGSGNDVLVRFLRDSGEAIVDATIRIASDGDASVPSAALVRLAGTDRRLTISVISAEGTAALAATIQILVQTGTFDIAEERAEAAVVVAAQDALARKAAEPPSPPQPGVQPRRAAPPSVELKLGLAAPVEVSNRAQPLPLERIRLGTQLVGEELKFTNSTNTDLHVAFLDDDGEAIGQAARTIKAGATESFPYETLARWAERDHLLAFKVRTAPDQDLWTGYLTTDVSLLESGRVFVPIDLTGVSDWRFVNPRRPVRIGPLRSDVPRATLEFVNRVPGRTIKLTFPPIAGALQDQFRSAGFEVTCLRPTTCTADLVLQAANRKVEAELLVQAYGGNDKEGLVTFSVAFFEGDIEPANAVGYIAVVRRPFEPAFSTNWNAVVNAGLLRDPYFAGFTIEENEQPVINMTTPFDGQTRWHMTGQVRLSARPQLGTRANAEIDLIVKDKDFGVADAPAVTAQKLRVNVFGYNGFSMSVGRFDFAAPTRSIAIAESGEGFSGRWRKYTVSHVIRPRERLDKGVIPVAAGAPALFPASPDLRDRWSTLAQAQWAPSWMRLEMSALTGRRKTLKEGEGRLYVTGGGDVIAANGFSRKAAEDPKAAWRLNGGLYASRREARADVAAADSGWSALVDGSVAFLEGRTPRLTVGGTLAMASRDDPATPQDEGYAGESAGFGPDRIFLASLAGKVAALTTAVPDDGGQPRVIRGGLTGKKYVGLGAVWQGYSPLRHLAIGVPPGDISAQSMTFRWQGYSLRNPVTTTVGGPAESWLGREMSLECLLESPRGVRYALTAAHFAPGGVFKTQKVIQESTWLIDARMTVTLK